MSASTDTTAVDLTNAVESIGALFASEVAPTLAQVTPFVGVVRSEHDKATSEEISLGERLLASDLTSARLLLLAARAEMGGAEIARTFGWLVPSIVVGKSDVTDRVTGNRLRRAAALVTEGNVPARFRDAWLAVRESDRSKAKAKTPADKAKADAEIMKAADVTDSSLQTFRSLAREGSSMVRVMKADPDSFGQIPVDVAQAILTASRKAHGEGSGSGAQVSPAKQVESALSVLSRAAKAVRKALESNPDAPLTNAGATSWAEFGKSFGAGEASIGAALKRRARVADEAAAAKAGPKSTPKGKATPKATPADKAA